ncbi:protein translocase subunit SecY [Candidatus Methanoplasma termitum]|uniref:Protein translocase subunit SecY n=1 Tax=Candidatus Methanoplasma termitum TaxID=1577791 RepID=A0A0A7LCL9_9ARCH|nr:preprotein translocase subunit SecY [Candidatus Methanoplasma termitum]AIZ56814.1 protein translocase subunit SecY [Candidatus Methanoplasma termitum]MCL2334303.1 preprotein translocase subunit SecY [Candidatus Methanoplasma sp.]
MEETPSLLYKVKPISDRLPSVKRPEGHVHFRTKMMWVIVILVLYFVMTNVFVYGLDQTKSLDLFSQYRTIMAGASGTILQLGIGPIVTASIIMQLFVGAKIIKLDLTSNKDKACYQSVLKLLVIVMILVESVPQVFGFLVPSANFESSFGPMGAKLLIILQLCVGSYIVFLFDEVVSKWGIGSGISLFIAAGVAQSVFTGALNWYPVKSGVEMSMSNLPAGTIPKAIYVLMNTNSADMANGGYEVIFLGEPNPMIALVGTVLIFLIVVYLESTRIELPLSHGNVRGARGRYPIKLMYSSNIPVILMSALLANVSMVALLLYSNDFLSSIPLLGGNGVIGYFPEGSTTAAGGIAWYLSNPSGITGWLMPILDPAGYGNGHSVVQNLGHVVIFGTVMIMGSIMFAKFWVQTTNLGPDAVARQIQKSGMQIPGFRRDPRVLKRVLERYIPTITILSGALIGALAAGADMIGTTGHATGTGLLLSVGILIHLYEAIGREQMMEMNPIMRGFFGGED